MTATKASMSAFATLKTGSMAAVAVIRATTGVTVGTIMTRVEIVALGTRGITVARGTVASPQDGGMVTVRKDVGITATVGIGKILVQGALPLVEVATIPANDMIAVAGLARTLMTVTVTAGVAAMVVGIAETTARATVAIARATLRGIAAIMRLTEPLTLVMK